MLSKPKMPTPYNTVVDANNDITCSCVLTEGNVGSYEVTISDLYGNDVAKGGYDAGIAYYKPNTKVSATLSGENLSNFGQYKWKARLFEKDSVSTWCAYGTLQNQASTIDENDKSVIKLNISAHQNIEIKSVSTVENTFFLHGVDYLKNGVNYYPNPVAYCVGDYTEDGVTKQGYKYLILPDITNPVDNIQTKEVQSEPIHIGIFEDSVKTNSYSQLITICDFSGNKYQFRYNHSSLPTDVQIYDNENNKLPAEKRVYKYRMRTGSEDVIQNIYPMVYEEITESSDSLDTYKSLCLGKYISNSRKFEYDDEDAYPLSNDCVVISLRDYNKSQLTLGQSLGTKYIMKINGNVYNVTGYSLVKAGTSTDIEVYTTGDIVIKKQDGTVFTDEEIASFKQGMQYTIYCNYVDSDEYYFQTQPNFQIKLFCNDSAEAMSKDVLTDIYSIQNTFYGYLYDYGGKMYQQKINSYKWTISVKTLSGFYPIYTTGVVYDNSPTLTFKDFIENEEYIISLEITTDDGIIYTSDEYVIRTTPLVLENVTDSNYEVGISTEFSYKKKCVIISWSEKLYEYCNKLAGKNKIQFDRIDIYKTSNGAVYNKVASILASLIATNNKVEDFIVGGGNSYEYVIYPVFSKTVTKTEEGESDGDTFVSYHHCQEHYISNIDVPLYGVAVIGIVPQTDDYGNLITNAYTIDYENIWHFTLNMKNDTSTFNMAHTLHEGQERFNKMSVGRRGYITSGVSAYVGDIDCSSGGDYADGMEYIDNWEEFVNNGEMKIICDQYGRVFVGDINECNYSYDENTPMRLCTINFNYTQLADINDIEVIVDNSYLDLIDNVLLGNSYGKALATTVSNEAKGLGAERV